MVLEAIRKFFHTPVQGQVFDVHCVEKALELPVDRDGDTPPARMDEAVLFYGGWSVGQLNDSKWGQVSLQVPDRQGILNLSVPAGYYRTQIPVFGSNGKNDDRQLDVIEAALGARRFAPLPVIVTEFMMNLAQGRFEEADFYVRAQETIEGRHLLVGVCDECIVVYDDKERSIGSRWIYGSFAELIAER